MLVDAGLENRSGTRNNAGCVTGSSRKALVKLANGVKGVQVPIYVDDVFHCFTFSLCFCQQ